MADIKKPDEIVTETYNFISDVKDSVVTFNEACLEFVFNLDEYNKRHLYDASILKKRMKDAVRRAASNEL